MSIETDYEASISTNPVLCHILTLSKMTLSIMTLSIRALTMMTLSIITLSI
jgi:hypothetical protein